MVSFFLMKNISQTRILNIFYIIQYYSIVHIIDKFFSLSTYSKKINTVFFKLFSTTKLTSINNKEKCVKELDKLCIECLYNVGYCVNGD